MRILIAFVCVLALLGCRKQPPAEEASQAQVQGPIAEPAEQPRAEVADSRVPLKVEYPEPAYPDNPYYLAGHLPRRVRLAEEPDPVLVPPDVTNVARGKPVTSSEAMLIMGELEYVTDGDKRPRYYVEFEPRTRQPHVTIDLEREYEIHAVVWWHAYDRPIVYFDVVVQVARDAEFEDAATLFNSDHDGSLGLGEGTDLNYFETNKGWMVGADAVVGRYVRLYNHTNSKNLINQYTEVEVYGREIPAAKQ